MGGIDLNRLLLRAQGMAVFRGVLSSEAGQSFLALLGLLVAERPDPISVVGVCARLWGELATAPEPVLEDAWQAHLVERILEGDHPFAIAAEKGRPNPLLLEQSRRDLRALRALFDLDAKTLIHTAEEAVPETSGIWAPPFHAVHDASPRRMLAEKLAETEDWGELVETLAEYYALHGAWPFGSYRAFRWEKGGLRAVPRPDPVRLEGLIGYEKEREPLLENTERLLAGRPAHHALLYGLPGTGKSSTVKAVAGEYADNGLKLVEL